jgi:hypothetical protein
MSGLPQSVSPHATTFASSVLVRPPVATLLIWDRRFYLSMAIASTVLVFLAFVRTFYLKAYFATPRLSALVQLHGMVFTAWMFFFIAQAALIAADRPEVHRRLGYAGGFLASAMVVLGTMVAFVAERRDFYQGGVKPDTTFLFSLGDILTFSIFIAAGFCWRHRREAHQRLMLLAVVAGLLSAAPPRLPLVGGHPAGMAVTGLAFLLAGPIYDLISRRRIHPAYIYGCSFALLTGPPARLALAATAGWHHMAQWLIGL